MKRSNDLLDRTPFPLNCKTFSRNLGIKIIKTPTGISIGFDQTNTVKKSCLKNASFKKKYAKAKRKEAEISNKISNLVFCPVKKLRFKKISPDRSKKIAHLSFVKIGLFGLKKRMKSGIRVPITGATLCTLPICIALNIAYAPNVQKIVEREEIIST